MFLTIDHISGQGAEHRKKVGRGDNLYRWLIRMNFPQGFQTLCFNCNFAKHMLFVCPHQVREKKKKV